MKKIIAGTFWLVAFGAPPLTAQPQEILSANVAIYLVQPYASTELSKGVLFPQTFNQLRDEAAFLHMRYDVKGIQPLAIHQVRFTEPRVWSGYMQYRGKRLRLLLGWHRREGDTFWLELGLTYGDRTLLRVPSFAVPHRGTFAVSGEVETLGTEAFLNSEGLLQRRPADKQILLTLTPVWRTQDSPDNAPGTLNVDPTTLHADLHITRERYYAEAPVDLSRVPIFRNTRTGEPIAVETVPHVQSLLVEAFDGQPTIKIFRGAIRFSPNVKVLGIVTALDSLGSGSSGLRATERLFSSVKPAAGARLLRGGLETTSPGSTAWDDSVTVEGNTVFFQLGITMGADDFRILLQYNPEAHTTATFDVELEDTEIRGVRTSGGVIVAEEHLGDDYLFTGLRLSGRP
ncbi:MAG: hypothetical protein ACE5IP_06590 [Terriglobia bacterium]